MKWRSVFINSMVYLSYLKPNTKTYKFKTADCFGIGEGEFKPRYNNHKKLLHYTDEIAAHLSNSCVT